MADDEDPRDLSVLEAEAGELRAFVDRLVRDRVLGPDSRAAWEEFWLRGRALWRTRRYRQSFQERRQTLRPRIFGVGGAREVDFAKAEEWQDAWMEWLWGAYDLSRQHPEARRSDLLCRAVCKLMSELIEGNRYPFDLEEHIEVLEALEPQTERVRRLVEARLAAIEALLGRGRP